MPSVCVLCVFCMVVRFWSCLLATGFERSQHRFVGLILSVCSHRVSCVVFIVCEQAISTCKWCLLVWIRGECFVCCIHSQVTHTDRGTKHTIQPMNNEQKKEKESTRKSAERNDLRRKAKQHGHPLKTRVRSCQKFPRFLFAVFRFCARITNKMSLCFLTVFCSGWWRNHINSWGRCLILSLHYSPHTSHSHCWCGFWLCFAPLPGSVPDCFV